MKIFRIIFAITSLALFVACSTTSSVPDDDHLYIGLKEIVYDNPAEPDSATIDNSWTLVQEEVDAALQTAPNGALFGSSYYRTPLPYGLWVWNTFANKDNAFAKWMTKSFGKQPVLMSNVNPVLRAQVATNVMRNNGYFNGRTDYEVIGTQNPKKQRISYHVHPGRLTRVNNFEYRNFPPKAEELISQNLDEAIVKKGTPFSTSALDSERLRIARLLRNNGFYYYQSSYASYLADTTALGGWANLRLQLADSIPQQALKQWAVGRITLDIKQQYQDQLQDSIVRRILTIRHSGEKPPVRARVILSNMTLRSRKPYNYEAHNESLTNLTSVGLFSNVDFLFTPRSDSDTLDLRVQCILNKPYEIYAQTNYTHKMSGRSGPQLIIGLTKNNAFRGGEKFDVNLHGSYEWETGEAINNSNKNSYEFGMDASVEWPRLLVPFLKRRRYRQQPMTLAKASFNIINRPNYYRMHTAAGEWSYAWKRQANISHEFSPLILTYQRRNYSSERFDSILAGNTYLRVAMQNMFIPKMRYSLTYSSPANTPNPVVWQATITEAGNLTSLFNAVFFGQPLSQPDKTMFKNAYAQFLKLETSMTKSWRLNEASSLVGHANIGAVWSFGNMTQTPYTEQFYVGGANSIRAFPARGIGPGGYRAMNKGTSYVDQTGDIKLLFNLEYRQRLFGSLHGAVFLDAGNVWAMRQDNRNVSQLTLKHVLDQTALGTGIGLRYDMDFLVIRLDWGIGLHAPYKTSKGGFYNFEKFKDSHTLHFAVGYPF